MEKVLVNEITRKDITRKPRLTKKQKFVRRTVAFSILLVVLIFIIGSFFKLAVEAGNKRVEDKLSNYKKVEVMVHEGDTIWNLVQRIEPNEDPREMIYLAEKLAGESFTVIHPGDVITLLKK